MSGEVIRRHTYGKPRAGQAGGFIGVAVRTPGRNRMPLQDCVAVVEAGTVSDGWDLNGYGAVLTDMTSEELSNREVGALASMPTIVKAEYLDHINHGDVLGLDFRKGYVRSL